MMRILLTAILFAGCAQTAQQSRLQRVGEWSVHRQVDPFNDVAVWAAIQLSPTSTPQRASALSVGCALGIAPSVYVAHGKYFYGDGNDRVSVLYRVDSNEPVGPRMADLGDNREFSTIEGEQALRMIRAMLAGRQIVIRVTDPLDGENFTDTYSLTRLREAAASIPCIAPLLADNGGV
jgi:hypothetical protein